MQTQLLLLGTTQVMLNGLHEMLQHVDVSSFLEDYASIKGIHIAKCAPVWTYPEHRNVYIIVFSKAVFFENKLKHSMIFPNQIRACAFHKVESNEDETKLFVPLTMRGVISFFPFRKPTEQELQFYNYIMAASPEELWDPIIAKYGKAEEAINATNPMEVSLSKIFETTTGNSALDTDLSDEYCLVWRLQQIN